MYMKHLVRCLMIVAILTGFTTKTSEAFHEKNIVEAMIIIERQYEYENAYEKLVDTLKWHEGYRAYPYFCLAEVLTVGHGHAIKQGDTFEYPLSVEQADSLLREDLDAAIAYVKKTTDLEHLQLLAIAHFVYALGSGNFQRSTLRQLILADLPIDDEILKWVHIRTRNGIIRHEHLIRSRRMELELYNNYST